ncbi:MAG: hypothetical protein A2Y17_05275 [Clostridiales bacterium GWF2_38_85]|nr:MAG: hypothetical protein A2Y17_05275 [Clostridiales bacterium GWF2_38_85]
MRRLKNKLFLVSVLSFFAFTLFFDNSPIYVPTMKYIKPESLTITVQDSDSEYIIFDSKSTLESACFKFDTTQTYILENNTRSDAELNIYIYTNTLSINYEDKYYEYIKVNSDSICFNISSDSSMQFEISPDSTDLSYSGYSVVYTNRSYYFINDMQQLNIAVNNSSTTAVVLHSDIDINSDFIISHPLKLVLNNHKLNIAGNLIFQTTETGILEIDNSSGEITVGGFFSESSDCCIKVAKDFFTFQENHSYYLNAKKYNEIEIEHEYKVVRTTIELLRLVDESYYPKLHSGDIIIIDDDIIIDGLINFTFPVSLELKGKISGEGQFLFEFDEVGTININETKADLISANYISIDAPSCELIWSGSSMPDIKNVSLLMNVMSYNGTKISEFGLGGNGKGKIQYLLMRKDENEGLESNIEWNIDGNLLYVKAPFLISDSILENARLDIMLSEGYAKFNSDAINEDGTIDLLADCFCTVTDLHGKTRIYSVITERSKYNIPVVSVYTDGGKDITSIDEYISATIQIECENKVIFPELEETIVNIKGRGHSTWKWDKKPYKLKFNKKVSVLGLTEAKDWVLLANYSDKSLIRNHLAMDMSRVLNNLPFTLHQYPVDLFLNGEYMGVYTLGEQIEVKTGRVEIDENYTDPNTGYLLEIGGTESGIDIKDIDYFHTETLKFIRIKSPDTKTMSKVHFEFIYNYFKKADTAVRNLTNYEDYIDIDSVIDWFIMYEISYNIDGCFRRSCYLTKEKDGKLMMGPIWDFDPAFGNYSQDKGRYDIWASVGWKDGYVGVTWMNYLIQDNRFRTKLKARWDEVKEELLSTAMETIDEAEQTLKQSQAANFTVWKILDIKAGYEPLFMTNYNTFELQLQYLRDFINNRYKWMDENIKG